MITFDDFAKLEIRIGKVISAEKVENADKLLKLMFDFGPKIEEGNSSINSENNESTTTEQQIPTEKEDRDTRQIVSGIAEWYKPEELVGKLIPVITNLEPRKFRGIESQGMILAADGDGKPVILQPAQEVPPGSKVR